MSLEGVFANEGPVIIEMRSNGHKNRKTAGGEGKGRHGGKRNGHGARQKQGWRQR